MGKHDKLKGKQVVSNKDKQQTAKVTRVPRAIGRVIKATRRKDEKYGK